MSDLGSVDILVNNAGIVTGRKFLDCPDSMVLKTMQVNSMAHFWVSFFNAFHLVARSSISSSSALHPPPPPPLLLVCAACTHVTASLILPPTLDLHSSILSLSTLINYNLVLFFIIILMISHTHTHIFTVTIQFDY